MIVRQFLSWARGAPPDHRSEAVAGLAQAYLDGELSPADRRDAATALTAMLDDPSPMVRHALADALADSALAPRPLIIALANDESTVAEVVLARSPVLMDSDLIDCAALGDEPVQTAIARRPYISVATAAALAEVAAAGALATLAANPGAEITEPSLWRMIGRHGADSTLRQALLLRPHLPLDLRHAIAVAASDALTASSGHPVQPGSGRIQRAVADMRDRATVALAAGAAPAEVERLVAYLRRTGQLTPALMLRALLSCSTVFVETAFAELARLPLKRVAGLLHDRRGAGLAALLERAGLPKNLKPAFEVGIAGWRDGEASDAAPERALLSRRLVERVLSACAALPDGETSTLTALLRRYEAEAAREAARGVAGALADRAILSLEYKPMALITVDRERLQDAA